MIEVENTRKTVVRGLKEYLNCPVIRSNQNAEMPKFPYVSYTITTLMSENRGTYGVYDDGKARKPVTTTISFTVQSDNNSESVLLAMKAKEWLDYVGTYYLNENGVIVQSVGSVTNRDNVITIDYEYRNGFDAVFWCFDEVDTPNNGTIETVEIDDDWNKKLENRLDGVKQSAYSGNKKQDGDDELIKELQQRLNGVV